MKLLVCVKQVAESLSMYEIGKDSGWVSIGENSDYRMNRFDEYALEEALLIKNQFKGSEVDVVTYGPQRAGEVLKRAMGMGADRGIHIVSTENGYMDPGTIAWNIADQACGEKYDLIFTGVMSEDMVQGQTGQMVAEYLNIPCASAVVSLKVHDEAGMAEVVREVEGGVREALQISLPALVTIQAGVNTPRYPTLSNILKAKEKELVKVQGTTKENRQVAVGVSWPVKSRAGRVLDGTPEEKAGELINILRGKNALRS